MKINFREIPFGQVDHVIVIGQKNSVTVFVCSYLVLFTVHYFLLLVGICNPVLRA